LQSEIIEPLKAILLDHKDRQKHTDATWNVVEMTYNDKKRELEKAKSAYFSAYKSLDDGIQSYETMPDKAKLSIEKKKRLTQKINQLLLACKTSEKLYTNNAYNAKDGRLDYITGLSYVLDKHQTFEEDRIKIFQDKLKLYYAKSCDQFIKKLELERSCAKSVEIISKEGEIENIIKKYQSEMRKIEDISFVRATSKNEGILKQFDIHYSKGESVDKFDYEATKTTVSQLKETDLSNISPGTSKIQRIFKSILADCWTGTDISEEKMAEFNISIKTTQGRKAFCESLNFYRTQGMFSISVKACSVLSKLLLIVLNESQLANEIESALRVLILSQTYYTEFPSKTGSSLDRVYLQQSIQSHPIWAEKEFWEKAIRSRIQELKDQFKTEQLETQSEKDLMIQSSAFGNLGTFAHNMIQFGIPREIVEKLIYQHAKENGLTIECTESLKVYYIIFYNVK